MKLFGEWYKLLDVFFEEELVEDTSTTAEFENSLVTAYAQLVKKGHATKKELKMPISRPIYDLETLTGEEEVIERVKSLIPNDELNYDIYLKLRFQIDEESTKNKYDISLKSLNGLFISDNPVLTTMNRSTEHNFLCLEMLDLKEDMVIY